MSNTPPSRTYLEAPLTAIAPNPQQPRTWFDPAELENLAATIRAHGVIKPITLEAREDGEGYYIEDGERRWRAAKLAGLTTIPALVSASRNGTGAKTRLERALVANLQHQDMNPLEKARAFQELIDAHGLTQIQVALRMGMNHTAVANHLLLLRYEPEIQDLIAEGKFHQDANLARALLKIPDPAARIQLVKMLVARNTSIKGCKAAAAKVAAALEALPTPTPTDIHTAIEEAVPAMRHATRRTGSVDHARYDALVHTGDVPMWPLFKKSVATACKQCAWADAANANICGECPVVDLVSTLIGKVNGR